MTEHRKKPARHHLLAVARDGRAGARCGTIRQSATCSLLRAMVEGGLQEYAFCEPPFWPSGGRPSPSVHFRANGKALVAWCDGSVTTEFKNTAPAGDNPHGGDAEKWNLGWCGPEENNGWWNPENYPQVVS